MKRNNILNKLFYGIFTRLFYGIFTDYVIAKFLICYCWLIGIRKNKRLIIFHSCDSSKNTSGGIVGWSEIRTFNWVWGTHTKFGFDIGIHIFNHDFEKAKQLNLEDTFIQRDCYNHGFYSIRDVKNYLKAQNMLKKQFNHLYNPTDYDINRSEFLKERNS